MTEKMHILKQKLQNYTVVIPPGQFAEYHPSGKTYMMDSDEDTVHLADNPYILEYLLYNELEEHLPLISNLTYSKKELIQQNKRYTENSLFFTDELFYIMEFKINQREIPVFKIFLDHLAFNRKKKTTSDQTHFFPWRYELFSKYANTVKHDLSEQDLVALHERLKRFQKKRFPEEAIRQIFYPFRA